MNTVKQAVMRTMTLALTAALLMTPFAPQAAAAQDPDVITIHSASDFLQVAEACALDTWSQGKTVCLSADIHLPGDQFAPVPTFGGTFDGGGFAITGLSLTQDGSNQGLFRYLQPGGVIQNLTVCGVVQPGGSQQTVGGIVGNNAGTILDCTFQGLVQGKSCVGGVVGLNRETGQIVSCRAEGAVQGEDCTGGVCGRNLGVMLSCVNRASVNTAAPDATHSLEDLDYSAIVDTERSKIEQDEELALKSRTDTGGVVGRSSGVVQGCSNEGEIGYPHVGYNVGGIAGRQTGFILDCSNTGDIYGRKDVGGVVGQAEPNLSLTAGGDSMQQLRTELDTLNALIDQALDHADSSSAAISQRLSSIGQFAQQAQDSSKSLLDSTQRFVDGNLASVNSLSASVDAMLTAMEPAFEDLAQASDTMAALCDSLAEALEALQAASNTSAELLGQLKTTTESFEVVADDLYRAAQDLHKAATELEKAVIVKDEAAVRRALEDLSTAIGSLGDALTDAGNALQALRDAVTGGDGLPEALEQLSGAMQSMGSALKTAAQDLHTLQDNITLDWQQLRGAMNSVSEAFLAIRDAAYDMDLVTKNLEEVFSTGQILSIQLADAAQALKDAAVSGAEVGRILHSCFTTIGQALDAFLAEDPVEFQPLGQDYEEASSALFSSVGSLSEELSALNGEMTSAGTALSSDLRAISHQFNKVFHLLIDTIEDARESAESFDISDYIEDTSDEDIAATKLGKVAGCRNAGTVEADRNAGGVAGAMAIEHSLDPEDDILPQPSFTRTYQGKSILHNCVNHGQITSKKDNVGGVVGRMDLGVAVFCQNYGPVESVSGGFAGGIAGYSASTIRDSYAKCRLDGKSHLGGIAGEGASIQGCCAIATIEAAAEFIGAIAGSADVEAGSIKENHFLDTGVAGVDSVSYFACAEPASFAWFQQQPDIPARFLSFTLTLKADESVVAQFPFAYGDSLNSITLPEVPDKEGYYGQWPQVDQQILVNDMTLEAVYTPWVTLLPSTQKQGQRPLVLAEGQFTQAATLHVQSSGLTPPSGVKEGRYTLWEIALSGTPEVQTVPLRILDLSGKGRLWQYDGGQWRQIEAERNGNYLLCRMQGLSGSFCVAQTAGGWSPLYLLALIPLAVVLAATLGRSRRRAKKQEKAGVGG